MTLEIIPGQPIKLPDGSLLLPEADASGSKLISAERVEEERIHKEVEQEITQTLEELSEQDVIAVSNRTLADVELPFEQMNAIMLVISYTLWGLDNFAISKLLGTTADNIERLRTHDMYEETVKQMLDAIRLAETNSVHGFLSSKAIQAAQVVVSTLKAKNGDLKLSAAKDILDRAGFRPVDRVEHTHRFEDELRIRYVSDDIVIPTIEVEV